MVRGAREGSASHHGDTGAQDFRLGQKGRTRRRPIAAIKTSHPPQSSVFGMVLLLDPAQDFDQARYRSSREGPAIIHQRLVAVQPSACLCKIPQCGPRRNDLRDHAIVNTAESANDILTGQPLLTHGPAFLGIWALHLSVLMAGNIVFEGIGFGLDLTEPVLDEVEHIDNAGKRSLFGYRDIVDLVPVHQLENGLDRLLNVC